MEQNKLECPHCGETTTKNGQPYKNISALNTHIRMHCKKNAPIEGAAHTHKYSLLKPTRPDYARAMNAGFTKICHGCGDLA